jgi:Uma2 family endonuclease
MNLGPPDPEPLRLPGEQALLDRGAIPPLQDGQRLSRAEFERRYDAMPGLKKAELIEGTVHLAEPASQVEHGRPHARIGSLLTVFSAADPCLDSGDNATVWLDEPNDIQPDAFLRIELECGGRSHLSGPRGYVEGPPELIIEVAASSADHDGRQKLAVYERNGVQEYGVWQVREGRFPFWRLMGGHFVAAPADADGVWRSQAFPGLYLDLAALLRGDYRRALAVLQEGLASPEHSTFLARLSEARG